MITKVLNAPINLYFDVTPIGTIMNRFSKDISMIDNNIAVIFGGLIVMFYQTIAVLIVMALANWYILGIFPFIAAISFWITTFTVPSYRENTRIETITRSPLLNLMGETYNGCSTIRAFGK